MNNFEKLKPKASIDINNGPLRPLKKHLTPYDLNSRSYGEYVQKLKKAQQEEAIEDTPSDNPSQTKS